MDKKINFKSALAQIVGSALGFAAFQAFGMNMVIPLVGAFAFLWLGKYWGKINTLPVQRKLAVAILFGHTFWMLIPLLHLGLSVLPLVMWDLTWMSLALVGLIGSKKYYQEIALAVMALTLFCMAMNVYAFTQNPPSLYQALVTHIIVRAGLVLFLAMSLTSGPDVLFAKHKPKVDSESADSKNEVA